MCKKFINMRVVCFKINIIIIILKWAVKVSEYFLSQMSLNFQNVGCVNITKAIKTMHVSIPGVETRLVPNSHTANVQSNFQSYTNI